MRRTTLRSRFATGSVGLWLLTTTPVDAGWEFRLSRPHQDAGLLALAPIARTHAEIQEKSASHQIMKLATDKPRYRLGELIVVTLVNELATTVLAPPPGSGLCSVVGLERLEAAGWVAEGNCRTKAAAPLISLGPRTVMTAALILPEGSTPERGIVSQPVRPAKPRAPSSRVADKPSPPGDLTPQYPEGTINVRGLLYPSIVDGLSPGTYRIVFTYAVGTPTGPVQRAYAGPFDVTP